MAGKRRRRLDPEESRRVLLEAGRQVAHEQPVGEPLASIRLHDVAARAGVTIGAIYHYWESQDDYRLDLLRHLLAAEHFDNTGSTAARIDPLVADGASIAEVVRVGLGHSFDALSSSPDQRVSMGLWAQETAKSIELLRSMYAAVDGTWSTLLQEMLTAYGREPRPPFDLDTITMTLNALADGMSVRHGLEPARVDEPVLDPDGDPWHLVACQALALLPTMTRPVDGSADERGDLWQEVARLLESR